MSLKSKNDSKNKTKPDNARGKYDEKLKVKGSFLDIIKASVKDAKNKDKKKS